MAETKARLGDLLVQEGFITDDQLIQALAEQKKSGKRLGQQLLDMGMVTESQMYSLLTKQKIRFGDLLVEEGYIDEDQLMAALEQQRQSGRKLGRQLIEMGAITEDTMTEMLARKVGVPKVDPNDYWVDQETAGHLPEGQARRFRAMVLEVREQNYLVAMADPTDLVAFDEINRLLDKPIEVVVAAESALLTLMGMVYRRTEEITHLAEELGEELGSENDIDLSTLAVDEDTASGPVVRVLQSIFDDAIKLGASDIHIEPNEKGLRIRTRKDGVLQEQILKQKNIHAAMVSLLKLMSNLDITERRLPQDGRFQLRVQKRSIDVRLSTLPLEYGEGIVMRLLDQSGGVTSLDRVGMPPRMLERFRKLIHTPNGIVLVTGPTGSGKSTTLYGALAELNTPEVKIITVEDPVEYRLDRINQVQVKEDIGLTFSSVLRTCLRQDPDIVMVGEMRDHETAEIGLRAAVTGHLVFSTLHTNDAVATINRLVDMGIEPFLLAASLRAVIAQRLLRRVCPRCREPYTPDEQEQAWLASALQPETLKTFQLYRGRGCQSCNNTGYDGRIGVFELLAMEAPMIEALRRNDHTGFARACAESPNYQPMSHVALEYARQGVTTLSEVFRVLGEADEIGYIDDKPLEADEVADFAALAEDGLVDSDPEPGSEPDEERVPEPVETSTVTGMAEDSRASAPAEPQATREATQDLEATLAPAAGGTDEPVPEPAPRPKRTERDKPELTLGFIDE